MTIPYRTRRALRNLGILLVALLVVLVLAVILWYLWLARFVVYTREGAVLDFERSSEQLTGLPATPPSGNLKYKVLFNEGTDAVNISTDLEQISGYYITMDMLIQDMEQVRTTVEKLPSGTPVMVEVKDPVGRFFYSSTLGQNNNSIDPVAMDELISVMKTKGLYTIAKVPAFRDYLYGLDHVSDGLSVAAGYLWADEQYCYWLNPTKNGTLTYLMQITSELKNLGFREVVFSEFCFPNTTKIVFSGDKNEALTAAAETLMDSATDSFAVSFLVKDPSLPLPEGRSRRYLADRAATEVEAVASQTGLEDTAVKLVFLTEFNDTRFDQYSVLRPITSATVE